MLKQPTTRFMCMAVSTASQRVQEVRAAPVFWLLTARTAAPDGSSRHQRRPVYLRSQSCYGYNETVQAIDAHGDLKWSWYGSEFDPPRIFPDQGMMLARISLGGWRHGDHTYEE